MLSADLIIVFGSVSSGIICALFVNRLLKIKKENKVRVTEDIKSEFNNLVFEKDVALEALNKINQFFSENKIDSYEKDRLLLKYGKLLERYDERIFKLQPSLEMQEIYRYRKQLYSLISDSIAKLDDKLNNFSNKFSHFGDDNNGNNKSDFNSMPGNISQEKTKPGVDYKYAATYNDDKKNGDRTPSLVKTNNNFDLSSSDENLLMFSSSDSNKNNNGVAEGPNNNYDEENDDGELNTKKEDLSPNLEDIDNIQKDILKILKRLENPPD
jgi:hypothetical protein